MNDVRVCSLCGRIYVYDEFENNGYEDVCNHCKPINHHEEDCCEVYSQDSWFVEE